MELVWATEDFVIAGQPYTGFPILLRDSMESCPPANQFFRYYLLRGAIGSRSRADKERALAYCQWKLNLRITGCIFEGKRLGWAAYFSQITSTSQLRAINHTISKLTHRFCPRGEVRPKSLIKTFYELQRGLSANHRYIPNFDDLHVAQKRQVLESWLGAGAKLLSDAEVERRFAIKISKAVRELEEDIAQTS